ncbi:MAG: T9SS type A sorting domain-containing protein [Salinivirgaceae bacterium]
MAVEESNSEKKTYYWEIYHLMGDPTLMPWIGEPDAMSPSYLSQIVLGMSQVEVTNLPAYARVALSNDGELLATATANASGSASLEFESFTAPTTAQIVITAQFKQPYIGELEVIPSDEPFVVYDSHTINDGAEGNGMLDYGENVMLDVSVTNVGTVSTDNVELTLSTTDEYVTITEATATLGEALAETTYSVEDAFTFTVSENVPDQHTIAFTLTASDGVNAAWETGFSITANAPVIELASIILNDADGNNNGNLDPGEIATFTVQVANTGHAASTDVTTTLTATSSNITVANETVTVSEIGGQLVTEFVHTVTVSAIANIGDIAELSLEVASGETIINEPIEEAIGLVFEDFESGDFTSHDWMNDEAYPWVITESAYEGAFAAKSGTNDDSQTSELSITMDITNEGELSFMYKVSSESGYDFLRFYIDGTQQDEWSGAGEWTEAVYTVGEGEHTFKWAYSKDGSMSSNDDCGYLDYIVFPPTGGSTNPDNNAPTMTISGHDTAYTDRPFSMTINAEDQDNDELTISCSTAPEWMTFTDLGNGEAELTATSAPMSAIGQTYQIPVSVTDGYVFVNDIITVEVLRYPVSISSIENASQLAIYPNPAKKEANLGYTLTEASNVQATIYNITGQVVKTVVSENQQPGEHLHTIDVSTMSNGVYFFNIQIGQESTTQRLIINQ